MTTETGAGPWGSALAMACRWRVFDIDLEIYMVKGIYYQKPYRLILIDLRLRRAGVRQLHRM